MNPALKTEPFLLRVRDWAARFETHRTRELRSLSWIPESTDIGGDTYAAIMDHPDGAAHYGVSVGIHIAASKGLPRGYLRKEDGRPHDAQSLARLLRMPERLVQEAISRLIEIGELEILTKKSRRSKAVASRIGAGTSRGRAEQRRISALQGTEQKGIEHQEEKQHQHHQPARGTDIDDAACEYELEIERALQPRRCWGTKRLSANDRRISRKWQIEGIELTTVKAAIVTGCIRKEVSAANNGGDRRINCLSYFNSILQEVHEISPEQLSHWERKLQQIESSADSTEAATATLRSQSSGSEAA